MYSHTQTQQLAVRNSFFLVIIFQVSKRMKLPTKKEALFESVFLLQSLHTSNRRLQIGGT